MLFGWRHRPELEIPPRLRPLAAIPPEHQRRRVRLLVIGLVTYMIGLIAFVALRSGGFRLLANIVGGISLGVYLTTLGMRIAMSIRLARDAKRGEQAAPRETG